MFTSCDLQFSPHLNLQHRHNAKINTNINPDDPSVLLTWEIDPNCGLVVLPTDMQRAHVPGGEYVGAPHGLSVVLSDIGLTLVSSLAEILKVPRIDWYQGSWVNWVLELGRMGTRVRVF